MEKIKLLNHLPELDDTWQPIDIELNENHLPFLKMDVGVNPGDPQKEMLFYLDLASSEYLEMLVKEDQKYQIEVTGDEKVLGTGLSGDFKGSTGVVSKITLGRFQINDCQATFPDAKSRTSQGQQSDGVIGGGFMKMFNTYYDYPNKKIWIRPSKHFDSPTLTFH